MGISPKQVAQFWIEAHGPLEDRERRRLLTDPAIAQLESVRPSIVRAAIRRANSWESIPELSRLLAVTHKPIASPGNRRMPPRRWSKSWRKSSARDLAGLGVRRRKRVRP